MIYRLFFIFDSIISGEGGIRTQPFKYLNIKEI
jgi:hypothetical protein